MNVLPPFRTGQPRVEQGYVQPLDGINILFALESEFKIDISDDAAREIRSVRAAVEGVEKLLAAK